MASLSASNLVPLAAMLEYQLPAVQHCRGQIVGNRDCIGNLVRAGNHAARCCP
jgi:hypothetical protein